MELKTYPGGVFMGFQAGCTLVPDYWQEEAGF